MERSLLCPGWMRATPHVRRAAAVAILVPGLVLGGGCSALFVTAPPPRHEKLRYFDCTTSNFAPVADVVVTALEGIALLGMLADSQGSGPGGEVAVNLAGGVIFGASAVWGFKATESCREAKAEMIERFDRREETPVAPTRSRISPWEMPPASGWEAPPVPALAPPGAAEPPGPADGGSPADGGTPGDAAPPSGDAPRSDASAPRPG